MERPGAEEPCQEDDGRQHLHQQDDLIAQGSDDHLGSDAIHEDQPGERVERGSHRTGDQRSHDAQQRQEQQDPRDVADRARPDRIDPEDGHEGAHRGRGIRAIEHGGCRRHSLACRGGAVGPRSGGTSEENQSDEEQTVQEEADRVVAGELSQQHGAGAELVPDMRRQHLEVRSAQLATPDRRRAASERQRKGSPTDSGDLRQGPLAALGLLGHLVLQDERDGALRLQSHVCRVDVGEDGFHVLQDRGGGTRGLRGRARLRPRGAQARQAVQLALELGRVLRVDLQPPGQLRAARLPGLRQAFLDADRRPLLQDVDRGFEFGAELRADVGQPSLDRHDRGHRRRQRVELAQELRHLFGLHDDLWHGNRHGRLRRRSLGRRSRRRRGLLRSLRRRDGACGRRGRRAEGGRRDRQHAQQRAHHDDVVQPSHRVQWNTGRPRAVPDLGLIAAWDLGRVVSGHGSIHTAAARRQDHQRVSGP